MSPAIWRQARAVLVAFHVMAISVAAFPAPEGGMDHSAWRDPTVQGEFAVWARWVHMAPVEFEDRLWTAATMYMAARAHVLAPFAFYLDASGATQPWRLFVAAHRYPARYQVQAHRRVSPDDVWETLFEERSATARWHHSFFETERVRSVLFRYAWPSFALDARALCTWIADWAFRERGDIDHVRCRYYKAPSPTPAEANARQLRAGEWVQNIEIGEALP